MRNYQDEQNKNYENTKQMFEACRNDVGDSKKARRTMPIVDDEICFADIPENGVCITSQFENGALRRDYLVPKWRRCLYAAQQYPSGRSYCLASDGQER